MSRKRTGLRNRHRTGRSTYSRLHKGRDRDQYGEWSNGRQVKADIIAGRAQSLRGRPDAIEAA